MIFQNHPVTGLLFIIAVLIASPIVGVIALLGLIINTALGMKWRKDCSSGLYGFDGMLVGAMVGTFYPTKGWIVLLAAPVAFLIKIGSEKFFTRLPQLTFPFVLTSWILFYIFPPDSGSSRFSIAELYFHSLSQVFLVGHYLSALLIIFGLWISSKRAAFLAMIAPLTSLILCLGFKTEIFGFSAVLTAVALGDVFRKKMSPFLILLALLITSLIQLGMNHLMIGLTAPFILVTWIFLILSKPDP